MLYVLYTGVHHYMVYCMIQYYHTTFYVSYIYACVAYSNTYVQHTAEYYLTTLTVQYTVATTQLVLFV
jgi:hypothetical protein